MSEPYTLFPYLILRMQVTKTDTINFIWKHLFCQFGIPHELVADNGTQFQNAKLKELCNTYNIKLNFASVSYPQSNGQAESTNKTIFNNIKKNLEDCKGKWLDELPKVLWAHRTTKRTSTGESPFTMVYGTEAVIPTEVGLPTIRSVIVENPDDNGAQLLHNLDLIEETRHLAQVRLASYQQTARNCYAKKVKPCTFAVGDWVLRRIPVAQKKLYPSWEGPYQIAEVVGKGAYTLREIHSQKKIPRTWNAMYLKKYYM